ncbi:hypothetical protein [Caulobacter endophyticus]|uniref:hypothetical protein n=1 Tax=Caulobacter endophyticus TaxID=2172652 RepID=UPI0011B24FAD|nr:hypothetical protein [Caulobacter endophyticus]
MLLSEFIEATVYEIALGVDRARVRARNYAAVNPNDIDKKNVLERNEINFDVSIVVSENGETRKRGDAKIGGELKVASVLKVSLGGSAGIEDVAASKSEHTHRVSFKVPIYLNANYRGNATVEAEARAMGMLD